VSTTNCPNYLIPSKEFVKDVGEQVCDGCTMMHRSNQKSLYTIGNEIDPNVVNFERFCGLSLNVLFCDIHPLREFCSNNDLKYSLEGECKKFAFLNFPSEENVPDLSQLKYSFQSNLKVIGFIKSKMEIADTYPFAKNGRKNDQEEFEFRVKIEYKPTLINSLHFEVTVRGNHPKDKIPNGDFHILTGKTSKKKYFPF